MIIVGVAATIIIIIIIVGAAVGGTEAKNNAYPNYTALSYSLADTCNFRDTLTPSSTNTFPDQGTNFYSNWDYWDTYDPALGFVHYDNAQDAATNKLTGYNALTKTTFLRIDNTEENASTGRHSARVSTRTTYDSGLFIFDIVHTPYGCASWPAVWLTNQYAWPNDGEIDVIEAVNQANEGNQMTLHTTQGCTMKNVKREMSGTALQTSCLNSTNSNEGCGVQGPAKSFGSAFNDVGGGVYAMELRDAGIRMWLFYRDSIPADITAGTAPNTANWGEAIADFPSTDCDISSHFKNLSIVANIDVCGSFAGSPSVYSTKWSCPGTNCTEYAAQNPSGFNNAFWSFNYFKVFKAA